MRELGENGIYHLKLDQEMRTKWFGTAYGAVHEMSMMKSPLFASARELELMPSLGQLLSMHDQSDIMRNLVHSATARIRDNKLHTYARVGGLSEQVYMKAIGAYADASERATATIANLLGMSGSVAKKIADPIINDHTPKFTRRAVERSQKAAGLGGSMADTQLPPKQGRSKTPPPIKPPKSAPEPPNKPAASAPAPAPVARRKSSLDLPGSDRKQPPADDVKRGRAEAAKREALDFGNEPVVKGSDNLISLAQVDLARFEHARLLLC